MASASAVDRRLRSAATGCCCLVVSRQRSGSSVRWPDCQTASNQQLEPAASSEHNAAVPQSLGGLRGTTHVTRRTLTASLTATRSLRRPFLSPPRHAHLTAATQRRGQRRKYPRDSPPTHSDGRDRAGNCATCHRRREYCRCRGCRGRAEVESGPFSNRDSCATGRHTPQHRAHTGLHTHGSDAGHTHTPTVTRPLTAAAAQRPTPGPPTSFLAVQRCQCPPPACHAHPHACTANPATSATGANTVAPRGAHDSRQRRSHRRSCCGSTSTTRASPRGATRVLRLADRLLVVGCWLFVDAAAANPTACVYMQLRISMLCLPRRSVPLPRRRWGGCRQSCLGAKIEGGRGWREDGEGRQHETGANARTPRGLATASHPRGGVPACRPVGLSGVCTSVLSRLPPLATPLSSDSTSTTPSFSQHLLCPPSAASAPSCSLTSIPLPSPPPSALPPSTTLPSLTNHTSPLLPLSSPLFYCYLLQCRQPVAADARVSSTRCVRTRRQCRAYVQAAPLCACYACAM